MNNKASLLTLPHAGLTYREIHLRLGFDREAIAKYAEAAGVRSGYVLRHKAGQPGRGCDQRLGALKPATEPGVPTGWWRGKAQFFLFALSVAFFHPSTILIRRVMFSPRFCGFKTFVLPPSKSGTLSKRPRPHERQGGCSGSHAAVRLNGRLSGGHNWPVLGGRRDFCRSVAPNYCHSTFSLAKVFNIES